MKEVPGVRRKPGPPGPITFDDLVPGEHYAMRPFPNPDVVRSLADAGGNTRHLKVRLDRVDIFSAIFEILGDLYRVDQKDVPFHITNLWKDQLDEPVHNFLEGLMEARITLPPGPGQARGADREPLLLVAILDETVGMPPGAWRAMRQHRRSTRRLAVGVDETLALLVRVAHVDEVEVFGWQVSGDLVGLRDEMGPEVGALVLALDGPSAGRLIFVADVDFLRAATNEDFEQRNEARREQEWKADRTRFLSDEFARYGLEGLLPEEAATLYDADARRGPPPGRPGGPRRTTFGTLRLQLTPAQLAHVVHAALNNPEDVETLLSEAALDGFL